MWVYIQADQFTRATAGSKLQVIAEQVRFLQQQARAVLEEANRSRELHHIACNFKKIPGKIYYVYRRDDGSNYMSMISPEVRRFVDHQSDITGGKVIYWANRSRYNVCKMSLTKPTG